MERRPLRVRQAWVLLLLPSPARSLGFTILLLLLPSPTRSPSSWIVHVGCVFVAVIHPSRT